MKPRATGQLAHLADSAFMEEVARGLRLTGSWIEDLERWATRLEQDEPAAADVLRVVADEEAGKFLILVDAVRCPKNPQDRRVRQLKRCNSHLAKGLYVEACNMRAGTYRELLSYLRHLRLSHYLDGPNDVDWIFRNEIEAQREQRLYVDYVQSDDGEEWWSPAEYDRLTSFTSTSMAVEIVRALSLAGIDSPPGLRLVAPVWRPFAPGPDSSWTECVELVTATAEALQGAGLASDKFSDRHYQLLVDGWAFPLYAADLSRIDVSLDKLRARQERWTPD